MRIAARQARIAIDRSQTETKASTSLNVATAVCRHSDFGPRLGMLVGMDGCGDDEETAKLVQCPSRYKPMRKPTASAYSMAPAPSTSAKVLPSSLCKSKSTLAPSAMEKTVRPRK